MRMELIDKHWMLKYASLLRISPKHMKKLHKLEFICKAPQNDEKLEYILYVFVS